MNVGILTHIPENSRINFYKTKNIARIRNFDDEVETDILKALLESISYQFNMNRSKELKGLNKNNFLKNELVFFINQIQFSEIRVLKSSSQELEGDILDLKDMYLYYDKKKSQRINANRVKSLASKMVYQSSFKNSLNRHPAYINDFNQQPIDFSLKMGKKTELYKTISFEYKNTNRFFNEIKNITYDLNYFLKNESKKINIIINNTDINKDYEKIAYNHLSKITNVYTLEEFDRHIVNAEKDYGNQLSLFN